MVKNRNNGPGWKVLGRKITRGISVYVILSEFFFTNTTAVYINVNKGNVGIKQEFVIFRIGF